MANYETSNKSPRMYDIKQLIQAGMDPKTGLPVKMSSCGKSNLREKAKMAFRIIDEQDAVNKYTWYNLPCNLTSQELERMLYYKAQLCFFYDKNLEEFYFMPYALDGTIDFYGRYNSIHPVPMTSGTEDKNGKAQAQYLSSIKLKCVYGIKQPWELSEEDLYNSAVILRDYTNQMSQTNVSRQEINDPIIGDMADIVAFHRTAMLASTGVKGMRVPDQDSIDNVSAANEALQKAALNGEMYTPVEGTIEFQELTNGSTSKSEDFMLALESVDNLRLSTHGIDNGGLFAKKAQMLQSEFDINGGPVGLVLQDGLTQRQNFCNIVNSIWGTSIWCEVSETISKTDVNGDGVLYDRQADQSQPAAAADGADTQKEVESNE